MNPLFPPIIRQRLIHGRCRARRLSAHCDAPRIAAEAGDVLLHPLQGKALVQQARVELAVPPDVGGRQLAEGAEAVLDLDGDEGLVVGVDQGAGVVGSTEDGVAAAVCVLVRFIFPFDVTLMMRNLRIQTKTGRFSA
ncbi:hypothetical protein MKX07_003768 [Trichoderma sp. CBMAI-0711]|nr:hypothetical protein MKX07_003768 [Trichoderma sp. CBMAI-0711]